MSWKLRSRTSGPVKKHRHHSDLGSTFTTKDSPSNPTAGLYKTKTIDSTTNYNPHKKNQEEQSDDESIAGAFRGDELKYMSDLNDFKKQLNDRNHELFLQNQKELIQKESERELSQTSFKSQTSNISPMKTQSFKTQKGSRPISILTTVDSSSSGLTKSLSSGGTPTTPTTTTSIGNNPENSQATPQFQQRPVSEVFTRDRSTMRLSLAKDTNPKNYRHRSTMKSHKRRLSRPDPPQLQQLEQFQNYQKELRGQNSAPPPRNRSFAQRESRNRSYSQMTNATTSTAPSSSSPEARPQTRKTSPLMPRASEKSSENAISDDGESGREQTLLKLSRQTSSTQNQPNEKSPPQQQVVLVKTCEKCKKMDKMVNVMEESYVSQVSILKAENRNLNEQLRTVTREKERNVREQERQASELSYLEKNLRAKQISLSVAEERLNCKTQETDKLYILLEANNNAMGMMKDQFDGFSKEQASLSDRLKNVVDDENRFAERLQEHQKQLLSQAAPAACTSEEDRTALSKLKEENNRLQTHNAQLMEEFTSKTVYTKEQKTKTRHFKEEARTFREKALELESILDQQTKSLGQKFQEADHNYNLYLKSEILVKEKETEKEELNRKLETMAKQMEDYTMKLKLLEVEVKEFKSLKEEMKVNNNNSNNGPDNNNQNNNINNTDTNYIDMPLEYEDHHFRSKVRLDSISEVKEDQREEEQVQEQEQQQQQQQQQQQEHQEQDLKTMMMTDTTTTEIDPKSRSDNDHMEEDDSDMKDVSDNDANDDDDNGSDDVGQSFDLPRRSIESILTEAEGEENIVVDLDTPVHIIDDSNPPSLDLSSILGKKESKLSTGTCSHDRKIVFDKTIIWKTALEFGDLEEIRNLVENHGFDVNEMNEDGLRPLHIVSCEGHLQAAEYLIAQGAEVNCIDKDSWSPLHCAACTDNLDFIKMLVGHGGDFRIESSEGELPQDLCEEDDTIDYFEGIQVSLLSSTALICIFAYEASRDDELSIKPKEKFEKIKNDEESVGWVLVKRVGDGIEGLVPLSHLSFA